MPKIIADLRENILLQARSLLLTGGFEALTMRSVASACKVAVGTVYNYFPSKEMLAASVMLQDWQRALRRMHASAAAAPSPLDGLRCIATALTDFWNIYRATWQGYTDSGHAAPLQGAYHQQLIDQLSGVITPLLEHFSARHEDALPAFLAEAILAAVRKDATQFDEIAPILSRLL